MSNLFIDAGPPASGQKVMLATTTYDSPDASYTFSIARSREALHKAGIQTAYLLLQGNCHVDDARNSVVRDFLDSDCTDLVFLDADVSWEPADLVTLCRYGCDVVGGVYPYRRESGKGGMPVRMIPGIYTPDENGLMEVDGLPTGFLRIRRHVIVTLTAHSPAAGKLPLLFERDVYEGGRRSGDIRFCMNWRATGGKIHAAANLRLGHCGKHIVRDSLAAHLRRQGGLTLRHVAETIRDGKENAGDFAEAIRAVDNPWGADADVLRPAVALARKAAGPIIEAGSGLTTILMAAANPDQTVWCLEHHPLYAARLEYMAREAGVSNIALVTCPIRDEWYDLASDMEGLPARFAVALIDGPPRQYGDRMKFFDVFGDRCGVFLADDADDPAYAGKLATWADNNGRSFRVDGRAAVILPQAQGPRHPSTHDMRAN